MLEVLRLDFLKPHSQDEVIKSDTPISAAQVDCLWRNRKTRLRHFPPGLFADPAWDMLLHLYYCELVGQKTDITGLVCAHVPPTTGLRWTNKLIAAGLCDRRPDLHDARRQLVRITPSGRDAMDSYFRVVLTDSHSSG